MKVGGYLTTSLVEWPGKIVAVVWTVGCNFRCPFCYNAHLVVAPFPKLIKESQIFSDLRNRRQWVDGVVLTGGEPTLQPDLVDFCRQVKDLGLGVMIETNGSRPEVIKKLIRQKLVDFWTIDYKTDWDHYSDLVNFSGKNLVKRIKKSFELILSSSFPVEVRTTIVPRIHSQKKLIKMAKELLDLISRFRPKKKNFSWVWQNFRPIRTIDSGYQQLTPYSSSEIKDLKKVVEKIVPVLV